MKDKFIEVIKGVVVNDKGDTIGKVFCPEFSEKIVDALISAGATVPLCGVGEQMKELKGMEVMNEKEKQAYEYIDSILGTAHYIELFVRRTPVVIMSKDILNLLKYAMSDTIGFRRDDEIAEVCGYKVQTVHSKGVLCVGINLLPETEEKDHGRN